MNSPAVYLDHAAATPLSAAVFSAMQRHLLHEFANPSSLYESARSERRAVEAARHTIADALGAKPTEIVFTSGGTEGNNMAIQGVLAAHPGAHWTTSAIEHDAVLAQVEPLKELGHTATIVPVSSDGLVKVESITSAITDETVLVSVMLANNEIGTIQPVAQIAAAIAKIRTDRARRNIALPLYLHTDAVQALNYLDLHVSRLGADLITINGSKIYGPKGTGALYIRTGTTVLPLMYGGGQERGRRSGTENVAGIIGLAAAVAEARSLQPTETPRLIALRDEAARKISAAIPGAQLNGHPTRRLPNNLNFTFAGAEGEALVLYLANAGFLASTGSACSTGDLDPSHVLLALGRTVDEANASLRLTFGRTTTAAHIHALVAALPGVVGRVRELSA